MRRLVVVLLAAAVIAGCHPHPVTVRIVPAAPVDR